MPVPERDTVDRALAQAREEANLLPKEYRASAMVLIHCTTAIVHQIRDADDTIATVLTPAINENLADLATQVGALQINPPENKRSIFS